MGGTHHNCWLIGLYVISFLLFVAELLLSSLNGIEQLPIFQNSVGNTSDYFELNITPASWTFSIWGFIYAFQVVWMIYAFSFICRRSETGYLYVNPGVLPTGLWLAFSASSIFIIGWLFVWDRLIPYGAFILLFSAAVSLHVALFYGHRQLHRIEATLTSNGLRKDVWLVRILVLNSLAFFNTWVSIATCLNMAHTIAYTGPYRLDQKVASSAALALLMVVIFFWFSLKTFIFEKQLRFTLSPFVVLVVGLTGSIYKNWDRTEENSIFTAAILTLVVLLFIINITHVIRTQLKENKEVPLVGSKKCIPPI